MMGRILSAHRFYSPEHISLMVIEAKDERMYLYGYLPVVIFSRCANWICGATLHRADAGGTS